MPPSGCVRRSTRASDISRFFPGPGRAQTTEGVRKLVTRKYAYIVYYSVDDNAGEIAILAVKHPAQQREHDDA